tara:strand:+ start:607 stop:1296 length:690 start_codon:yes stop_codon:yes gene_type:complete
MNAGDGSSLQLPPAFVMINPRQHRRYKKGNQDQVDGRTSGAKELMSRINKRKMKKEQVEEKIVSEGAPTNTERAQKQIAQKKKLNRQKDLQNKKDTAKKSMVNKSQEMDVLMKARLQDFKKKATSQTTKLKKINNSTEFEGETMIKETQDVVQVALDVATQELNPSGETNFAKIDFADGSTQNLDTFSAKRIAAAYAGLEGDNQKQYQYMLNKDAATFQSALDFAIRNV